MKREVTDAQITYRFTGDRWDSPPELHFSLHEYRSTKKYKFPYSGWRPVNHRGFGESELGSNLKLSEVRKIFKKWKISEVIMETTVWRHNRSYSINNG